MKDPAPVARDLVLIGGGHSHVILLRRLAMKPLDGLQITLVSPEVNTPYSGMLPGLVAGHYTREDIHIDLVRLCRFAGARFFRTNAFSVDPVLKTVACDGRPPVSYDVLSIDTGITPSLEGMPGAREHAIAVKPISLFLRKWERFLQRALAGEVKEVAFVGAGAGGVELCMAVMHRLEKESPGNGIRFHLVSDKDIILPELDDGTRNRFRRHCRERGIELHFDFPVAKVSRGTVISSHGDSLDIDEIFWVTSAAAPGWIADTGISVNESGFITIRDTLQAHSHEDIFASGDIAVIPDQPRPRAGVFAVRQGPVLEKNVRRYLLGKPLKSWRPQREFLKLIITGDKYAVASRNKRSIEGRWVWYWKDRIDRRFMRRFTRLPPMQKEAPSGLLKEFDALYCGGCGAKVGSVLLNEVLDKLGISEDRDDAAISHPPTDELSLHTVDGFRSFIDDPRIFAEIAVQHALSDIYAMGGKPDSVLAMVTLPFGRADKNRALLEQLLSGVLAVLREHEIRLAGGHTTEGIELGLGFAVNGSVPEASLLRKSGMQPGDRLVLTKPLGTGALLAADMQYRAKGIWIEEAAGYMRQSNAGAADCLKEYGATACTDVTGFGIAGHLMEMLEASGVEAVIRLDSLPVMNGALEVINRKRIRSTLHDVNRTAIAGLEVRRHEKFELLFDPQTSGGLLASVPAAQADRCRQALGQAGYDRVSLVGKVRAGLPVIHLED